MPAFYIPAFRLAHHGKERRSPVLMTMRRRVIVFLDERERNVSTININASVYLSAYSTACRPDVLLAYIGGCSLKYFTIPASMAFILVAVDMPVVA